MMSRPIPGAAKTLSAADRCRPALEGATGSGERRRSPRPLFAASLRLSTEHREIDAFAIDACDGGLSAVSPSPLATGERLTVDLRSSDLPSPILCDAEVVWSHQPRGEGGAAHRLGLRLADGRAGGPRLQRWAVASDERRRRVLTEVLGVPSARAAVLEDLSTLAGLLVEGDAQTLVRGLGAGERSPATWPWVSRGLTLTTLPCVAGRWRGIAQRAKLTGAVLDTLIDDVADKHQDPDLLEQLLILPTAGEPGASDRHPTVASTRRLGSRLDRLVRRLPRHDELRELLDFDYRQLFNAMRYSLLVNRAPEIFNALEHDAYLPHNMHMMASATIDLMASPAFDRAEIGLLREVAWHAQMMGRLGNMLITWQREIGEGDVSSGIFAWALSRGDLSPRQLQRPASELLQILEDRRLEAAILDEWHRRRRAILALAPRLRSVDLERLVEGLELLLRLTIVCWGIL